MTSINIINPFVTKDIISRISDYDWDSMYTSILRGYIVSSDELDITGTVIHVTDKVIKLRFNATPEIIKNKFILYQDYNDIEIKHPITHRNGFGYISINIDDAKEREIYFQVVENPTFLAHITKKQNSNIKSFNESGIIFSELNDIDYLELRQEIEKYQNKIEKDFHPFSDNKVIDIVHPSLYPYIKNKAKITKVDITKVKKNATDYWNRKYEKSNYQWLPSEFNIDLQGNCKITSYINNLPEEETKMTSLIEKLFSKVLPKMELMWSYIKTIKLYNDEYIELYNESSDINNIDIQPISFKGKTLQVITKIVTVELDDSTVEGAWHVEGMSHENIVATAVCVLEQSPDLETNLYFKRRFTIAEGALIFNNTGQERPRYMDEYLGYLNHIMSEPLSGLIPLGKVSTKTGSITVFPNSHIHKLDIVNNSESGKRTVVVFWLINPDIRIISTKHVEKQQNTEEFTHDEALEHRLKLMHERKYHKQNFNVRDLNLCEH
jgi:hypothetical protein